MGEFEWFYASVGAGVGAALAGGSIWLWSGRHLKDSTSSEMGKPTDRGHLVVQ